MRVASHAFAEEICKAAGGRPAFVLIQDCSLALVPAILRLWKPDLALAQFWQFPWPHRETFRVFPWKRDLLDSMLASDLLAFQQHYDCRNFLDAVDSTIEAKVDPEQGTVSRSGRTILVRQAPMSIDFEQRTTAAASAEVQREMDCWRRRLGPLPGMLGLAIDPLDCNAGIPEHLRAIDLVLEQHPEYRERFTFVQVCLPGHASCPEDEVASTVARINARWGNPRWRPILLLTGEYSRAKLTALQRLSDFFLVTSLHEGMNLAAKEFVAARPDGDGVLILSQFAGAHSELSNAILVNPFAENEIAGAIGSALTLPAEQRRSRMQRLRSALAESNAYRWAGRMISTVLKLEWLEPAAAAAKPRPIQWPELEMAAAARAASRAEVGV